ncbi:MAG: transcription antitermination factor NusB [Planctomycetes bacterium]|jgi:transcription antitermination factor NusB|nr:transcription antitermination factor NusB [Planctomycetota bacterium]
MKSRTRGRELALQFLYQVDLRGRSAVEERERFLRDEEPDKEARKFAEARIEGVLETQPELDRAIQEVAQNWDISRMAVIDRNVLRIATFELLHCKDIPPKVAINEAIEIGKRFSTANSGAFINGILDKIKSRHVDKHKPAAAERSTLPEEAEAEPLEADQPALPEDQD